MKNREKIKLKLDINMHEGMNYLGELPNRRFLGRNVAKFNDNFGIFL